MKKELINKLKKIGGLSRSESCIESVNEIKLSLTELENLFRCQIPQSYKDFYYHFGAGNFNNRVTVKCLDSGVIMLPGQRLNVGSFYCVSGLKDFSILSVLSTYEEQLSPGLMPICDGELGDVICLSLRDGEIGHLYYFHHESPPGADLYLISRNFDDFIMSLDEAQVDYDQKEIDSIKMDLTPEFIELLKKSGFGPK
ncbi:SMI1/KNR4 family protein [Mucilaginibacter sp. 21P]|uniref:SMI1/KNR4 family protein n=1 Tax=Mucilaginibacter sp. 21P TaxID=2778902 RepID=UPI001C566E02|nr:SMI1/KNR4 family protein [Mucilaginibacter sp. 21P]QXV63635.1 SMI1/KNR4 family protein [Mucilaginibacter sp. 21P]